MLTVTVSGASGAGATVGPDVVRAAPH